ncbi:hypothetical protein J7E88_27110 [Streptomyces sp. ISL-10]|uniref:hypothetical protein n=1 Tax=Streptomyces sp. ISL-10 TaxID=2819172 RepID=UPI001BE5B6C2|nr:hypothetical protein [Streptomyces sp. ISL-10]MBT2368887.1 hypothetical protein [Streptomyces sp. ISL-10]
MDSPPVAELLLDVLADIGPSIAGGPLRSCPAALAEMFAALAEFIRELIMQGRTRGSRGGARPR